MKSLGEFLRTCLRGDFEPCFVVEDAGSDEAVKIPLREARLNDMYLRGTFKLNRIRIVVSKELSTTNIFLCLRTDSEPYPHSSNALLPISGFPRELMSEDNQVKGEFVLCNGRKNS